MKNILITLILITVAASCSKKENESEPIKELVTFSLDSTAPFPIPIIDWTKDSKYVKENLPKGVKIKEEKEGSLNYNRVGIAIDATRKIQIEISEGDYMTYYFDKNDLIGIVEFNPFRSITTEKGQSYYKYFEKKIGQPNKYRAETVWTAKNVLIVMPNVYSYICFAAPDKVRKNYLDVW